MSYFSIFAISFTIALSGALMPGPLLATVIYESTKSGSKAGPLMIIGHALLEIIMVIFIVLGFTHFLNSPSILRIIYLIGAIILVFFGLSMILSLTKISLDFKNNKKRVSNLTLLGITMSVSNPYWTIWWLTIGLGLVLAAQKQGLIAIAIFFLGHILADFGWYSIVSLMIGRGKRFISDKVYKIVIFFCALTLIGFGIYFLSQIGPSSFISPLRTPIKLSSTFSFSHS